MNISKNNSTVMNHLLSRIDLAFFMVFISPMYNTAWNSNICTTLVSKSSNKPQTKKLVRS